MIGVFDSGVGGLTVLSAIRNQCPSADLLYLGDTARVPYGTRSGKTVVRYALRVASHLAEQGIDTLVIACNTATTYALDGLKLAGEQAGIEVIGVIEPGVSAALAVHTKGDIAVVGTHGTINGQVYQKTLAEHVPHHQIHAIPCPLFVPLVEEGWIDGPVPTQVAESYLGHLRDSTQTLLLGCTHYPLLKDVISTVLPTTHIVDSATATATHLRQHFSNRLQGTGRTEFLVTDNIERFQQVGSMFLGEKPNPVKWIDLHEPKAPFVLSE